MKIPSPDFLRLLSVFAEIYAKSTAGRNSGDRDFIIDSEKFLKLADAQDGDARELAMRFFDEVGDDSQGLLKVIRHRRTGAPIRLKLHAVQGEEWLFQVIKRTSPQEVREQLADFFRKTAETPPECGWKVQWQHYFRQYAEMAAAGKPLKPFSRSDLTGNRHLVAALRGVILWEGESLMRYASSTLCGDSKALKLMESRLCEMLATITGFDSFEPFGILAKPRIVSIYGPLELWFGENSLNLGHLPGPAMLSEINFQRATAIRTRARCCLTVENEETFLELTKLHSDVLMIHTSFPGAAVRKLISQLPSDMVCYHFGDTDPSGFDILRDLREKTSRIIRPLLMEPELESSGVLFTPLERAMLERLMETPAMADLKDVLAAMLQHGQKVFFEQEAIPLKKVARALQTIRGAC